MTYDTTKRAELESLIEALKAEITRKKDLLGRVTSESIRGCLKRSLSFTIGQLAASEDVLQRMKEDAE